MSLRLRAPNGQAMRICSLLFTTMALSLDPLSAITSALRRENLIPDVLPEYFNPTTLFSVVYPNGKEVLLGNEFQVSETEDEPSISFMPMNLSAEQADSQGEEVAYTLVMLDPDVPSRKDPQFKTFRHWVVRIYRGFLLYVF